WWRETLQKNHSWEMSPVTREEKIAFTEANPIKFPDDDLFGYMRAQKNEATKKNETLTRVSPLKNSALISVVSNSIVQNWSSMTRQEGDAVPYGKDEYCATMKGMFSIDLEQVGTFSSQGRTGFVNINEALKKEALNSGAEEIDDPFAKDKNGKPLKLYRLTKETREKRISDVLNALHTISGGAKQTTNLADVTPKFLILATLKSGNHPFSHIVVDDLNKVRLSVEGLEEVLNDYKADFIGNVFIGRRKGFLDEADEKLKELTEKFNKQENGNGEQQGNEEGGEEQLKIVYCSIGEAIKNYVETLKEQPEDNL
ncbi:type I-B CRISPR-associated protein Cas7/Cst2/DevR, partial [bacterium]|nr:type I-B CRISPR-associated protein Cas7/Cst2/DevR [bacterium]